MPEVRKVVREPRKCLKNLKQKQAGSIPDPRRKEGEDMNMMRYNFMDQT